MAYCSLGIRCGTRNEKGFSNGIAHFTEHALFKGTAHRSASSINSYLDRLGGELNAFTTKEEIVLHSTVLKEDLRKAAFLPELSRTGDRGRAGRDTRRNPVLQGQPFGRRI